MRLLVDAGNTRIKWALAEDLRLVSNGILAHEDAYQLLSIAMASANRVSDAYCVSVAGADLTHRIDTAIRRAGIEAGWFRSSAECCGVRNGYDKPEQLGADRWAALVGAWAEHRTACLVVSAGTATTVDILDAAACFQGGLILPGEHLMRQSLSNGTAQLPLASGKFCAMPRNTADAIISGCLNAQAGAIERMYRTIENVPGACCLLAGGSAARLAPLLTIPVRRIDDLVLRGLALAAHEFRP